MTAPEPASLSIGGISYSLTGTPRIISNHDGEVIIDLGHLAGDGAPVLITVRQARNWLRTLELAGWAGRIVTERDLAAVTP
jgi:hypothetical protein